MRARGTLLGVARVCFALCLYGIAYFVSMGLAARYPVPRTENIVPEVAVITVSIVVAGMLWIGGALDWLWRRRGAARAPTKAFQVLMFVLLMPTLAAQFVDNALLLAISGVSLLTGISVGFLAALRQLRAPKIDPPVTTDGVRARSEALHDKMFK